MVASVGQPAPGAGGALFAGLDDPIASGSSNVAFVGTLKTGAGVTAANATGVWVMSGGTTSLVARTGSPAATGANFASTVNYSKIDTIGLTNAGGLALLAARAARGGKAMALFGTDL